ncbi:DUF2158 domain-containing protein [Novosphingobium sp. ERN07]|nr:DUF2158 domain-containing protein [Novosphingobium sp. ERN07]
MEFSVGDTVQLKSGGEVMTVEGVSAGQVDCVWFNAKKVERSTFDVRTLESFKNDFSGF